MNSLYKLQMVHRKYSIFILILSILRDTKAAVENVRLDLKGRWKGEVGKEMRTLVRESGLLEMAYDLQSNDNWNTHIIMAVIIVP